MKINAPRVSVVIPAYNQANYLTKSIQSAISQTYHNFEIIVVDDGSTDLTPEVSKSFGNRIRYIRQSNLGLGGARNTGIRAAEGEFIGLLDADDEWTPEFLEKTVDQIESIPNTAAVYSFAQAIDSDERSLPQIFGGPVVPPKKLYQTILRANFLIPSTILIRRPLIIAVGMFEETNRSIHGCEDWDLWLRVLRNYPDYWFLGIPECLVRYRLHNSSISIDEKKMQLAVAEVIKNNFGTDDDLPEQWASEKRLAYGGVYRYQLISTIQRSGAWQTAPQVLIKALHADPTLSVDLDLFYDLALGSQPIGFRGTMHYVDIEKNARLVFNLLNQIDLSREDFKKTKRPLFGTAYYALGLVAYNTGNFRLSRKYLLNAVFYRPGLLFNPGLVGDLVKSNLSPKLISRLKNNIVLRFKLFHKQSNKPSI